MENDIIIVTDHIEIHPSPNGSHWAVVRDGAVYGTYADLSYAQAVAKRLAAEEGA